MDYPDNVIDIRRPVRFSIDGQWYETTTRRQQVLDLLLLAGRDPADYDLAELRQYHPVPVRYLPTTTIRIRPGAQFVAVRDQAGVV
jgi:hypothetical protein